MIRRMTAADAGAVADIWLAANLDAHGFIPAEYWRGCQSAVREAIAGAEVYVYEGPEGIEGFIGLEGEHIAGLFVRSGSRSRGLGHALLEAARAGRAGLSLSVYEKNAPARRLDPERKAVPCGKTARGRGVLQQDRDLHALPFPFCLATIGAYQSKHPAERLV